MARPTKKQTRVRTKLLVLLVAGALAILVGEVIVRLFLPVAASPFLRDYHPVHWMVYKKNLHATIHYPEFVMEFSTNSRGYRGPEPPPSSKDCVLFLGDSFTEGWGVSDGEEYPSLVRDALDERYDTDAVPVINASMSNTGNYRWMNVLKLDAVDFEPRLVVFQLTWNDSYDNWRDGRYRLGADGKVIERPLPPKPLLRKVQSLLEWIPGLQSSHLFALMRQMMKGKAGAPIEALDTNEPGARPELDEKDHLLLGLTEEALSICEQRGWPTAMITVMIGDPRLAELRKICARHQTPLLDIRNRIERPELYYEIDMHWNAQGHRFMADLVLDELLGPESPYLDNVK